MRWLLVVLCCLALVGCGNGDAEEPEGEIANPASVYCRAQGGTVEIRTDAEGNEHGVCVFQDGSECDEWAHFRGECEQAVPTDDA
jgi:putative hemolysin